MNALGKLKLACLALLLLTGTARAQPALYFVHSDHLNTPRLITNASQQAVWKWDQQEPFGDNVADENPSGLGAFDLPLRLTGQRYDKETGLHYSYFRDCYDSGTGRFCEPDPIGTVLFERMAFRGLGVLALTQPTLEAEFYTDKPHYNHLYAYAGNNPISFTDPTGLLIVPNGSGFPAGSAMPGDLTAFPSGSGSNMQVCSFSWKDERRACRDSCKAIGRAMGGLSGEAYTSRCIMMCNLTYTKP